MELGESVLPPTLYYELECLPAVTYEGHRIRLWRDGRDGFLYVCRRDVLKTVRRQWVDPPHSRTIVLQLNSTRPLLVPLIQILYYLEHSCISEKALPLRQHLQLAAKNSTVALRDPYSREKGKRKRVEEEGEGEPSGNEGDDRPLSNTSPIRAKRLCTSHTTLPPPPPTTTTTAHIHPHTITTTTPTTTTTAPNITTTTTACTTTTALTTAMTGATTTPTTTITTRDSLDRPPSPPPPLPTTTTTTSTHIDSATTTNRTTNAISTSSLSPSLSSSLPPPSPSPPLPLPPTPSCAPNDPRCRTIMKDMTEVFCELQSLRRANATLVQRQSGLIQEIQGLKKKMRECRHFLSRVRTNMGSLSRFNKDIMQVPALLSSLEERGDTQEEEEEDKSNEEEEEEEEWSLLVDEEEEGVSAEE